MMVLIVGISKGNNNIGQVIQELKNKNFETQYNVIPKMIKTKAAKVTPAMRSVSRSEARMEA